MSDDIYFIHEDPAKWHQIRYDVNPEDVHTALGGVDHPVAKSRLAWTIAFRQGGLAHAQLLLQDVDHPLAIATRTAITSARIPHLPVGERVPAYRAISTPPLLSHQHAPSPIIIEAQALHDFIVGCALIESRHIPEGLAALRTSERMYWTLGIQNPRLREFIDAAAADPSARIAGYRASLREAEHSGNNGLVQSLARDLAHDSALMGDVSALRQASLLLPMGEPRGTYTATLNYLGAGRQVAPPKLHHTVTAKLPDTTMALHRLESQVLVNAWKLQPNESYRAAERLIAEIEPDYLPYDCAKDFMRLIRGVAAIYTHSTTLAQELLSFEPRLPILAFYFQGARIEQSIFLGNAQPSEAVQLRALIQDLPEHMQQWSLLGLGRLFPNTLRMMSRIFGHEFTLASASVWWAPSRIARLSTVTHPLPAEQAMIDQIRQYVDDHPEQSVALFDPI